MLANVVGVEVEDGLLRITGTEHGDGIRVAVNSKHPDRLSVAANRRVTVVKMKDIRGIEIDAGGGDDHVMIDSTTGVVRLARKADLGDGDDRYDGGAAGDSVRGGAGNDTIVTGGGLDVLDGGAGADLLAAGAGGDVLRGGSNTDTLHGGDGRDYLLAGDGADHLIGGRGDDTLYGGGGNDTLQGLGGDDLLIDGDGQDGLGRMHAARDDDAESWFTTFDEAHYPLGTVGEELPEDLRKHFPRYEPVDDYYSAGLEFTSAAGIYDYGGIIRTLDGWPSRPVGGYVPVVTRPAEIANHLSGGGGDDRMVGGRDDRLTGGRGRDVFGTHDGGYGWVRDRASNRPVAESDVAGEVWVRDVTDYTPTIRYHFEGSTRVGYYLTDVGPGDRMPAGEARDPVAASGREMADVTLTLSVAGLILDGGADARSYVGYDGARLGDYFESVGLSAGPDHVGRFLARGRDRVVMTVNGVETEDWMEHRVSNGDDIRIEFVPAGF